MIKASLPRSIALLPVRDVETMPGPTRKPLSAKKSRPPAKRVDRPGDRQRAGRVIGMEGGEAPAAGQAKPRRPGGPSRPGKAAGTGYRGGKRMPPKGGTRGAPHKFKRRRPRPAAAPVGEHPAGERLQKVLAAAGLGSRRQCEELITTGRVEVNRKVVTELGTRVDPATQEVRVDGESLSLGRRIYYAVNKPRGVVTTNRDPGGRPRVVDLVPQRDVRLFAIGRLDMYSEGLILVTNDGELANRLTHPRYGVAKVYLAQVAGQPTPEVLDKLRRGVHLAEGVARVEQIRIESQHKDSTWLEITLSEGMNREIRRLFARVGHKVLRLVRVEVGPIKLGKLPPGVARPLTPEEIQALQGLGLRS
jgi:23S rRNA pseudouridine2605 synthase